MFEGAMLDIARQPVSQLSCFCARGRVTAGCSVKKVFSASHASQRGQSPAVTIARPSLYQGASFKLWAAQGYGSRREELACCTCIDVGRAFQSCSTARRLKANEQFEGLMDTDEATKKKQGGKTNSQLYRALVVEGYEIVPVRTDPWMMRRADPKKGRGVQSWHWQPDSASSATLLLLCIGRREDAGGVVV